MALVLLIFLRLFFLLVSRGSLVSESVFSNISLNSSLNPHTNPSWLSPLGLFAFGFYQQDDGFAVGIWLTTKPNITVVWTANRDDPPLSSNTSIKLDGDGLLLHYANGEAIYVIEPYYYYLVTSASMLDSGNFVLYNHSGVVWESFDYPCDTILGGQKLDSGNWLVSSVSASNHSSGRFILSMQDDGNLVAYPENSSRSSDDSYWSTGTYSTNYRSLYLNRSGSLYLSGFDETRKVLNPPSTSQLRNNETVVYRATLNEYGNFELYSHIFTTPDIKSTEMRTEWAALKDECKAKGFCGANSYCSTTSNNTECHCFPGFIFYNNTGYGKFFGCYKNFTDEEACSRTGLNYYYFNITAVENIKLQALYPYSVMNLSKTGCSQSCMDDCHCWASLYVDNSCKKLKDSINYAYFDETVLSTVFIKIKVELTTSTNKTLNEVRDRKKLVSILAIAFGFLAFMCTVIAFSSFFYYKANAGRYQSLSENVDFGFISDHFTLRSFSFDELQKATDGFKELIGRNSMGEVYKGFISEGKKAVAVKRLERVFEGGAFQSEITAIAQTHHRNLVRLLGFCIHGATKLLVYEFMSNGSLADLFNFETEIQIGWNDRARVALDVARGILYLQEECEVRIIHCNIKPHNILFDESWTAKISDFGLSKLLRQNQSGTLTSVRGTRGYLAPEWFKNTLITTKVDIYSFGVVLLEIICFTSESDMGIDIWSDEKKPLFTWVYNCLVDNELHRLIGDEEVDIHMMEKMVKVGLLCVQDDPNARPAIKDVILMLEGTFGIPIPPSPTPLVVLQL